MIRVTKQRLSRVFTPVRIIFVSYIVAIFIGALLLHMPISRSKEALPLPFFDCLFTATSALCATGLSIVPMSVQWSIFGQNVILMLIQIGGLGIITFTSLIFIKLNKKIAYGDRLLLQNTFNYQNAGGSVARTLKIIQRTLIIELCGAFVLTLYFFFSKGLSFFQSLHNGIFLSVSALCNAGLDLLGSNSLMDYLNDVVINSVIIPLIILGGIGFLVWDDVIAKIKNRKYQMHLTSQIAIKAMLATSIVGTLFFLMAEYNNPLTLAPLPFTHKLVASFFQAITLQTAGFVSMNQAGMREVSKFVSSLIMIVGGAPGSMAGGIKTVTMVVILSSIWSIARGRKSITISKRSISLATLQKALAVAGTMLILLFMLSISISILENELLRNYSFVDILYESSSALATVGSTTGLTPYFKTSSKTLLMIAMLIGRIGPITIMYVLSSNKKRDLHNIVDFPEGKVLIG